MLLLLLLQRGGQGPLLSEPRPAALAPPEHLLEGPGLPRVSVYDLVVHSRDGDVIAGTHGRGFWILDDITPLQQLTPEVRAAIRGFQARNGLPETGVVDRGVYEALNR